MSGEALGALLLTVITVVAGVFAVAGAVHDGALALVGLQHIGVGVLVVAALVLVWRFRPDRAAPSGRIATPHAHVSGDGPRRPLLRHEGAHVHAARSGGIRVERVEMTPTRGTVHLNQRDAERASPRAYMAVVFAGRAAAGPWQGIDCTVDDGLIAAEQRHMRREGATAAEVRKATAQAKSDAASYARSGKVDTYADRLAAGRL